MPVVPHRLSALSATTVAALVLVAAPAAAGDCWVATRAPSVTGFGDAVGKPAYARLKGAAETAEQMLRGDPRLNAIAGVRYQARRTITFSSAERDAYAASTYVGLHYPKVWGPGCTLDRAAADYLEPMHVTVTFNEPADIFQALASPPDREGSPAFALPPETAAAFERTGVIAYNGAAVRAYRAGGGRAIVPFRVRDHLDFWEKELKRIAAEGGGDFTEAELARLRARRASLSPGELEAQAAQSPEAMSQAIWGYAKPGEDGASPLYRIAPEIMRQAGDKGAVNMVVASYSIADTEGAHEGALRAWLEAFDFSPLDSFLAK